MLCNSYRVIHPSVTLLVYPTSSCSILRVFSFWIPWKSVIPRIILLSRCQEQDKCLRCMLFNSALFPKDTPCIYTPCLPNSDNSAHLNGYRCVNAQCHLSCDCNCLKFPSFSAAFSIQGKITTTSHFPSPFLFTRCGCTAFEFHFYWPSSTAL